MASMGALRTLLEAGVFHAIPTGGQSISAKEISAKTGVDKEMIGIPPFATEKSKLTRKSA
jgi:hypothetical protein